MSRHTLVFVFTTTLAVVGCALVSRDVTDSREMVASGWIKGRLYEASQPLFLVFDRFNNRYLVARSNANHVPPRSAYQCWAFTLPRNLQEYELHPSHWPEIVRILPSGTKLRFEQAYNHGAVDWSLYDLDIRASLEDGSKLSVNLACVSTPASNGVQWQRDEAWLRE